jgi:arylsulfatase A-like enzyme/Tfp pilus assembly protein PilF
MTNKHNGSLPAGILWTISALVFFGLPCAPAEHPSANVILITIDTVRADHLGCYGYKTIETPSIDRLAREGVRFAAAYTPVPITLPAHAALMTGQFPPATGMHDFSGNRLRADSRTIAKVLREHGYTTAAFIGSAVLDSRFGLNAGFDTYFDHFEFGRMEEVHLDAIERRGDRVVDEALKWLKVNSGRPLFLWLHLYDPHAPYNPPEPYASRYRSRPYDGEIAFADAQVGRFLAFLREQGLFGNSLVVLASDHGEGLGEHGEKTHGFFIYNSTLHVPLIVKAPGTSPRLVRDEVSLVDVVPTLLQALGIAIPSSVQGRSLWSLVLGRPGESVSNLYAESYPPFLHFGWSPLRGFQWKGLKYIETTRPELYDLRADPRELHDLVSTRQAVAQEMKQRFGTLVHRFTPAATPTAEQEPTDPALLETLRSLGYVAVSTRSVNASGARTLTDPKDRIHVYELVSAALTDSQQGRYHDSLRKLLEAAQSEPDSSTIRFLTARDYLHLSDFSQAAEYFQSVLKLDPNHAMAAYYHGVCELQAGKLDPAEGSFQRALELDPTNFAAAFNLGVVYSRERRSEAAVQAFRRATEILPGYAEAHEALGELYLYLGHPQDALPELQRAVALAPEMAKAHYQLGRAYRELGFAEKSQREFDRAKPR